MKNATKPNIKDEHMLGKVAPTAKSEVACGVDRGEVVSNHEATPHNMSLETFLEEVQRFGGNRLTESLHTSPILPLIYDAVVAARSREGVRVLNVFASNDKSGFRESVYMPFFNNVDYVTVDFWNDRFIFDGQELADTYSLPLDTGTFDIVITTKIILEHVSEPLATISEFSRILKPGGELFLIVPFAMSIHQPPHDYFRFTEHGIRYLLNKAGLEVVYLRPTHSAFITAIDALTHSNFFEVLPKSLSGYSKKYWKRWMIPLAMRLDRKIADTGKLCRHYVCRAKKPVDGDFDASDL